MNENDTTTGTTTFRETAAPKETKSPDAFATPTDESYAVGKDLPVYEAYKGNLELWESESGKKYVNEIFDTHNIGSDFTVKMHTSKIDKFIRAEIEERGWNKTTDNYKAILQEYEGEIGSDKLPLFERFKKLTTYIQAVKRLREAKKRVGAFKPYVRED